ncbi:MAG: bifunctional ornithine acetyltransferase/N-acetylglutamate synthase [Eggerthella lenta]
MLPTTPTPTWPRARGELAAREDGRLRPRRELGRIAAAIGKSGAVFRQEDASIDIMGLPVCRGGLAQAFDEDEALRRFEQPEIVIDVDLGAGEARTTVWTCDFTHEYITINGDYRS